MPENPPTTEPAAPSWIRFLVPSATDLIFIILLAGLTCGTLSSRLLNDAGIGWHVRNGQQMLETHSITETDSFSETMSGQRWYAWEWLYDLGIAEAHERLGLNGVVFVTAVVIAATFAIVFRLALCRGGILPPTVILLMLSVGASAIHWFARPHVLSWLLAVVCFQLLDSSEISGRSRRLYWLPLLMLLWVNVHGGFVIGFALFGLYLAGGFIRYFICREREGVGGWLCRLGAVTVLSLLAGLVNPFGYGLYWHVYEYLTNGFLMSHIEEFRSPNFHGVAEQCFVALLLVAIATLSVARSKPRASQLLVILFAAWSGLYASRNLPVSSMLLVLIVAPLLGQAVAATGSDAECAPWLRRFVWRCESFTSRMGSMELGRRGHLWGIATVAFGLWLCLHQGRLGSQQLMNAHFDARRFPVQAVDAVASRGASDPIFCPDYWGGYLIYRLYPQTRVLVDDRHDLYGEQFLKDYLKVMRVEPGWDEVLSIRRVNRVLVPAGAPLASILRQTPEWTSAYEDGVAVLFERTTPL